MINRSVVFVVLALAFAGCETPKQGVLREAGITEEEDASPPAPDAPVKADAAPAGDLPPAPPIDTAPYAGDGPPPDTGPSPCSNGTVRCAPSGTAIEVCTSGQWTTKEACPLTCSGAVCTTMCMANVPCTQGIGPCRKGATTCATPSSQPGCADVGVDDARGGCPGGNVCKAGACVAGCQSGVACTQGIKACRRGATFCATPTSEAVCNEAGVDDARGGCGSGQVCKAGDCVAACQGGVACTQGIGPCRKGATFCATPTSTPVCNDSGVDDSKGGCSGGRICKSGQCVDDPCESPSSGNLVPNADFDSGIWPKFGNTSSGTGSWNSADANGCPTSGSVRVTVSDAARICVTYGSATNLYFGYEINRTGTAGQIGCGVDSWYHDTSCTDVFDLGTEFAFSPNVTGWRDVSMNMVPPANTKSFLLSCHHTDTNTQPVLFDRIYLRASPGGF